MFDKSTQEATLHNDWHVSIPALSWNRAKTMILVTILLTVTTPFVGKNCYVFETFHMSIDSSILLGCNQQLYKRMQLAIMSDITQ
jgi:hypothetical protein